MAGGSLVVSKVAAGSQAEAAGLKLGFILTAIGGKSLAALQITDDVLCAGHLQKAARVSAPSSLRV